MTRAHVRWAIAGAVVLAALAAAYLWWSRPLTVRLVRPQRGEAVELVYATGFVEPMQPVTVAARLSAPVTAVLVDEGDTVRRGQALLTLDDGDLRMAYLQARALRTGAVLAERRAVALFAQGWVTQAARDEAVANASAARAAERMAAAKLGQNVVRAGLDAVVIKRDIEPGELAAPTRTLMLLGNPRLSWVTATIDERDVPRVRVGQRAWVSSDAWPGRNFLARVAALTPTGDPEQRAFRARLVLDQGPVLPLGMSLEVNIVTRDAHGALLVPNAAIVNGAVWTVVDGRAHRRPVTLGIRGQASSQVAGLADDAPLIEAPSSTLAEGASVVAAAR